MEVKDQEPERSRESSEETEARSRGLSVGFLHSVVGIQRKGAPSHLIPIKLGRGQQEINKGATFIVFSSIESIGQQTLSSEINKNHKLATGRPMNNENWGVNL